jgi:hypothetical protein
MRTPQFSALPRITAIVCSVDRAAESHTRLDGGATRIFGDEHAAAEQVGLLVNARKRLLR